MKTRYVLWLVALLLASGLGMAGEKPASDSKFPVPPQQDTPWSLPEKVPDPKGDLKTAVDTMFKLGLADPRGCAYHDVTVKEGGKIHEARGWVLPSTQGDPTRYAIGWNGLIYQVENVGKEADLAVDLRILIDKGSFQEEPFSNYQEESLGKVISECAATPRMMREWAAPYLLLRLGADITVYENSADLVNFADPFAKVPTSPAPKSYSTDLYIDSDHAKLTQFARLIRGDGVTAFIDKNDRLAANRLETFDRVWAEVVHRITHEEGEREIDPFAAVQESLRPKLNSVWRSLLVDAQRRLAPEKTPGKSVIEKEIATWDEVENWDIEENWQRDISIPPASFERVVAAGPAAIAPLLACLESDSRWTRAQWGLKEEDGHRRMRPFVRVRDLAICALNRILRFRVVEVPYYSEYDSPVEDAWYVDVSARAKKICGNYGNTCGGELWFRILADEKADIDDHLQAAICIARPASRANDGLYLLWDRDAQERIEAPKLSIEGNQLRARHDPSVMDLMQQAWRRSRMMTDKAIAEGAAQTKMPITCGDSFWTIYAQSHELMLLMEEWHHGNLEVLKEHYDWLSTALANMRKAGQNGDFLVSTLCEETLVLRFWAEDKTAMRDYETLFRSSIKSNQVPIKVMQVVPQETGMDALAMEAFLGEKATLSLVNKTWERYDSREGLIKSVSSDDSPSPLMVLPSYRHALIEALQTKTKQGTLVVTKGGCSVKYDSTASAPESNTPPEPTLPGTGQEVRLCDIIADLLTPNSGPRVWGSPQFRLQDSLAKRDHAIEEWIKVLSNTDP